MKTFKVMLSVSIANEEYYSELQVTDHIPRVGEFVVYKNEGRKIKNIYYDYDKGVITLVTENKSMIFDKTFDKTDWKKDNN